MKTCELLREINTDKAKAWSREARDTQRAKEEHGGRDKLLK